MKNISLKKFRETIGSDSSVTRIDFVKKNPGIAENIVNMMDEKRYNISRNIDFYKLMQEKWDCRATNFCIECERLSHWDREFLCEHPIFLEKLIHVFWESYVRQSVRNVINGEVYLDDMWITESMVDNRIANKYNKDAAIDDYFKEINKYQELLKFNDETWTYETSVQSTNSR